MEMFLERYFKAEEQRYVMQLADRFNKTTQGTMNGKAVNILYPFNIPAPGTGLKNRVSEPKAGSGDDEYFKARDAYVKNNYAEALKLYKLSSEKGNVEAMCSVALLYLDGKGIAKNKIVANAWFKESAGKGHEKAKQYIDEIGL